MKKISSLFFIFVLVFQGLSSPVYALSNANETEYEKEIFSISADEKGVSLYEDPSESSDLLITLHNGDQIEILEEFNDFTLINFFQEDSREVVQGFVENETLNPSNDKNKEVEQNTDIEIPSESIDTDEKDDTLVSDESPEDIDPSINEDNLEATEETNENPADSTDMDKVEENTEEDSNDSTVADKEEKVTTNTFAIQSKVITVIGLRNPTNVREIASTKSSVVKTFPIGSIIELRESSSNWYEALENNKAIGYVHKKHISNTINSRQISLKGIGINDPTNIRALPSTKASIAEKRPIGDIISLRTFSQHWYEATTRNGQKGYVHKNHIGDTVDSKQTSLKGIGINNSTNIRVLPSTKANIAEKRSFGDIISLKTFSQHWYEATTSKGQKGYVHKNHVHIDNTIVSKQESLKGIGIKSPTNIRTLPSTKVAIAEKRPIGDIISLKTFSQHWYEATTNKGKKGYVHKKHIGDIVDSKQEKLEGIGIKKPTNIRELPSTQAKVLEKRPERETIQLKTFSKNWYEATTKSGQKGYVHKNHINEKISINNTVYDINLKSALDIQMKAKPQTDKKVAWVSKDYIKKNKVTASSLHVRTGPGGGDKSLGTISKGTIVNVLDEHNNWYMIAYNHNTQWVHAGPKDVLYYLNPNNFIKDEKQMLQFLDLSKPSGATKNTLNTFLQGKGTLSGRGKAFIDAGKKHKINDVYLLSHSVLETGNGSSRLASGIEVGKDKNNKTTMVTANNRNKLTKKKVVYNMFGIKAFDSCAIKCGAEHAYDMGWTSVDKAIVGGAQFINSYIGRGQDTLYKMRWNPESMVKDGKFGAQYATDIGWASKQVNSMYNIYSELDSYILQLDIPTYNK